jgi:hypothetical protein
LLPKLRTKSGAIAMSERIEDFLKELLHDVSLTAAANGEFKEDVFFRQMCDHLVAAGELETHERTTHADRGIRIDGHGGNPDEADGNLSLIVLDFHQDDTVESLTGTEMDAIFNRLTNFMKRAREPAFRNALDDSSTALDAAVHINAMWMKARRVKLILISNRRLSARVDGRDAVTIDGKTVTYSVWDLERLWKYVSSGREREDMELDLVDEFGGPIPALPAHLGTGDYEAFLCVVPGAQIARIYDRWGSRLLEQNVRSFLQLKGNVNKGMARTIRETPEMFFAYNNGITATAEAVTLSDDGTGIARIRNLQIVNGGQTTASLHLHRAKGGTLDNVFVQMKLSIVRPERSEEVVPRISEYANTQNKVNAADFFANHPFHIELEKLSRRILAPPVEGTFTQTRWFYERSRGQYQNAKASTSGAAQKKFDAEWPKAQLITKTDLAKFLNLWPGEFGMVNPCSVCRGAQKTFSDFAANVSSKWSDTSLAGVNDEFFKECVAKAIIFLETEKIVSNRPWYQKGYRAQIVGHALAKLAWDIQQRQDSLNFTAVWDRQTLPPVLHEAIIAAVDAVREVVTSPAQPGQNITEWAKITACWQRVQALEIEWPEALPDILQSVADARAAMKGAKATKKAYDATQAAIDVINLGASYWQQLVQWPGVRKAITPKELSVVALAAQGRSLSDKQGVTAMEARDKAIDAGFPAG